MFGKGGRKRNFENVDAATIMCLEIVFSRAPLDTSYSAEWATLDK